MNGDLCSMNGGLEFFLVVFLGTQFLLSSCVIGKSLDLVLMLNSFIIIYHSISGSQLPFFFERLLE